MPVKKTAHLLSTFMRLPFDIDQGKFETDARVKFTFNSPELHQNIEISIDGEETSVEVLLDAFHRFLNALGINTPDNVILGFIEINEPNERDGDEEDDDDDDEEDDEEDLNDNKSNKPKKPKK
jgi:hypothetical protein